MEAWIRSPIVAVAPGGTVRARAGSGWFDSRFEVWAASYETTPLQTLVFTPVRSTAVRLATRYMPTAARVLDVCCGTGRLLRELRSVLPDALLVGIDPAVRMLAEATRLGHGPGLRLVRARAEQLPFESHGFDLVFATMSIRHWSDPQAGIAELVRVLRPGGVVIVADVALERTARRRTVFRRRARDDLPELLARFLAEQTVVLLANEPAPVRGPVPDVRVIVMARPSTSLT